MIIYFFLTCIFFNLISEDSLDKEKHSLALVLSEAAPGKDPLEKNKIFYLNGQKRIWKDGFYQDVQKINNTIGIGLKNAIKQAHENDYKNQKHNKALEETSTGWALTVGNTMAHHAPSRIVKTPDSFKKEYLEFFRRHPAYLETLTLHTFRPPHPTLPLIPPPPEIPLPPPPPLPLEINYNMLIGTEIAKEYVKAYQKNLKKNKEKEKKQIKNQKALAQYNASIKNEDSFAGTIAQTATQFAIELNAKLSKIKPPNTEPSAPQDPPAEDPGPSEIEKILDDVGQSAENVGNSMGDTLENPEADLGIAAVAASIYCAKGGPGCPGLTPSNADQGAPEQSGSQNEVAPEEDTTPEPELSSAPTTEAATSESGGSSLLSDAEGVGEDVLKVGEDAGETVTEELGGGTAAEVAGGFAEGIIDGLAALTF